MDRSKLVRKHAEAQHRQIMIDILPAYAPDMNPVECIRAAGQANHDPTKFDKPDKFNLFR